MTETQEKYRSKYGQVRFLSVSGVVSLTDNN